ncbi:MAG: phosphoribosyltransferase [bacterium]|nr:phosphoribosyltransferase [bacterium]
MKLYYSWNQFGLDVGKLAKKLASKKKKFDGVWGPARGGLPIAVCLSHELGLPFLARPKSKKTLIVDDIADTGATLFKYAKAGYFIATIFYHRQSKYVPKIWLREKKNQWVVFPWERT